MLCMFGNDFYVKKGDVLRIEIARISERYLFAVSEPGGSRSERLVLVYNSCGLSYEISTFKDDESDAVSYLKKVEQVEVVLSYYSTY